MIVQIQEAQEIMQAYANLLTDDNDWTVEAAYYAIAKEHELHGVVDEETIHDTWEYCTLSELEEEYAIHEGTVRAYLEGDQWALREFAERTGNAVIVVTREYVLIRHQTERN